MSDVARCRACNTPMRHPSPDGLGPKCRRNQRQRHRGSRTGQAAAAARKRLTPPAPPAPGQLTIPKEHLLMSETRLVCLSPEAAAAVVAEATRPGDPDHTVHQDGAVVVIGYFDKRFPLDVADWAGERGHASDHEAASVIARL